MTMAHLLELGRTGAEPLRESAGLVAGPLSGRLWKKAMLEAVEACPPRKGQPSPISDLRPDAAGHLSSIQRSVIYQPTGFPLFCSSSHFCNGAK